MPKPSTSRSHITIRMGAAAHTVTLSYVDGDDVFDLRTMEPNARGRFYGEFMAGLRRRHKAIGRLV